MPVSSTQSQLPFEVPCSRFPVPGSLLVSRMTQNVAFLFVLVVALGFFAYNAQRLVRYLGTGLTEHRTDHPWTRLRNVLVIGIAQTKILRDPFAGILHASVFWGFIVLTLGSIE